MDIAFKIDNETLANEYYRKVFLTTENQQLVVMKINNGIKKEIHHDNDQFIKVVAGECDVIIDDDKVYKLRDGDCITIPSNTYHEVLNTSNDPLYIYTIYSPPHHPPDTAQYYED